MKSIRIKNKNFNTNNAFVVTSVVPLSKEHTSKFNQFTSLLNTCDLKIEHVKTIPEQYLWQEFDYIFIDLFAHQEKYDISNKLLNLAQNKKVVFFNAAPNVLDESELLLAGVAGIFYQLDRADIILKGIDHIKQDGLWFKRATMDKALTLFLSGQQHSKQQALNAVTNDALSNEKTDLNKVFPKLTKREKMIVDLVSSGAQNKEIAEHLHISPNTVKTHIYSIFRKTSSRNRIELLAWTRQLSAQQALN